MSVGTNDIPLSKSDIIFGEKDIRAEKVWQK